MYAMDGKGQCHVLGFLTGGASGQLEKSTLCGENEQMGKVD